MKNTTLVGILAAPLMAFAMSLPAWAADVSSAATTCKDGTTSATTGRGVCSGHGGVQKASKSKAAADAAAEPAAPAAAPAAAGAALTCKDGTTSTASGRGACSGHGGVQKTSKSKAATTAAEPAAAAPAAGTAMTAAAPAAAGNTNPAGATAKCKDGTYSKSRHRSGTCSKHGGVADWLGAQ
jgi:hypothetical protein